MGEERFFVTVDIRSTHGSMADMEQFRKRHGEAAMAPLKDGGISFYLAVFTVTGEQASDRVRAWAQECFASPQYQVAIRLVEAAPMAPPEETWRRASR